MNKESDIKIYETRDYSQFRKMLGNRDAKSENKIVESIKAVGLIPNPIIVNEKMEVIDGQNRLAALQQLEMPVYYLVVKGLDIEACRRLNIGQTNWGLDDYIASYANQGVADYQRLSSLINEFRKPFTIEGIVSMAKPKMLNEGGSSPRKPLMEGTFTLSREEYELATTRMRSAIDLGYGDLCRRKQFAARIFWACVSYIYQSQEVNAKDVIEQLIQYEATLPSCNRVSDQLAYFEDAVNRGVRRSTDKVFLSTDFQKRKYIERA